MALITPRDKTDVEAGAAFAPKFDADGLIPAVAVDHKTGDVLMVAYMNAEALAKTVACGSRARCWGSMAAAWMGA